MKIFLYTVFVLVPLLTARAQDTDNDTIERHHFNHWSLELNAGVNKPVRPFAEGYTSTTDRLLEFNEVQHYDLGIRYMLSNSFGFKFDLGYDDIRNQKGGTSYDFNTVQYRLGLQGVVNLGRIMRFESFTSSFGLLAHAGLQVSKFKVKAGPHEGNTENDGGIMYGITPQFRLNNWLVITGDFTALNNFRQHFNWDGSYSDKANNLAGTLYNTSLGLTVYFGDQGKKHADWYIPKAITNKTDEEFKKRLDEIETLMNDTDKDGVPDYLDAENNTPAGVPVDTKGRFIDENKNGVPDVMERRSGSGKGEPAGGRENSGSADSVLKALVEGGYVNVYFDVNKDMPNSGSANSVQQIYQYLVKFPESKIILYGYADIRGAEANNKRLSEQRAQKLKAFFVSSGIDSERISFGGQGVDKTFPSASKAGLDQARRVSVELIK